MDSKKQSKAFSLFNSLTKVGVSAQDLPKAEKLIGNLGERIADFRLLLNIAKDSLSGKYKISAKSMAIIGGAILYVLLPIDIIPDFLPIIGWTDDIAVIGYAMAQLSEEIEKYKEFKGCK